jgi:hypothetical protein
MQWFTGNRARGCGREIGAGGDKGFAGNARHRLQYNCYTQMLIARLRHSRKRRQKKQE